MAKKRQIVLMKGSLTGVAALAAGTRATPARQDGTQSGGPIGTISEVKEVLAHYNTAPDGSPRSASLGTEVLHGPGLIIELPTNQDEVTQALVTVIDDDIAWPVLSRLCKAAGWKMMDVETGRVFG
ncbi:MAG: hypothetical protein KF805_14735 [Phycisphaeraceae bacterium]|nr:hypothetical protein [Phycisphaeraceae bacterium]